MPSYNQRPIDPPEKLAPTPQTPDRDLMTDKPDLAQVRESIVAGTGRRDSRTEVTDLESSPKPATASLRSRTGTLSWQQRPSSRDFNGSRFSFSTSPTREGRLSRAMSTTSNDDHGLSRSPGTRSPLARDSFSLRPPERDAGSPTPTPTTRAEEQAQTAPTPDGNLHGTRPNGDNAAEPEKENGHPETAEEPSRPPSRTSSAFAESSVGNRYSSVSSVSTATGLGSPVRLSSTPKLEPQQPESVPEDSVIAPLSPRRLSPERSTSPTKGLGGFVQSAMMKRSDSVSKRWSAQVPSGLMRGNSFVNNRNSFAAPSNTDSFPPSSPTRLSRSGTVSSHRPTSSHSEATIVREKENERPVTPPAPYSDTPKPTDEVVTRSPLARHKRSTSSLANELKADANPASTSPVVSRTMDPKRWSPTKATWLESALNRPESPRHRRQPSQQASWAKERQSRGSIDLGRVNSFKEVTPVGLMRTAAPGSHSKTSSISKLPDVFGTPDASKPKDEPVESVKSSAEENIPESVAEKPARLPESVDTVKDTVDEVVEHKIDEVVEEQQEKTPEKVEEPAEQKGEEPIEDQEKATTRKRAPSMLAPSTKSTVDVPLSSPLTSPRDPLLNRPKPQSPVIDFRANLRKREVVKDQSPQAEPEFKNVFGRLRKAETSNYVAPDELKENILRGKAALNATGGPKKSQRVDELKESILKQKEAMKAGGGSVRRNTAGEKDAPMKAVPEAIAARQNLTKSSSAGSIPSSPVLQESATPRGSQDQRPPSFQDYERTIVSPSPEVGSANQNDAQDDMERAAPSEEITENKQPDTVDVLSRTGPEEPVEVPLKETLKPVRAPPSENIVQDTTVPAATEGLATKGKLAGRINPALAGLLSRGPPILMDGSKNASASVGASKPNNSEPAGPLTHMTKNRVRGPKRRPPKAAVPDNQEHNLEKSASQDTSAVTADTKEPEDSPLPVDYTSNTSSGWPLPEESSGSPVVPHTEFVEPAPPTTPDTREFVKDTSQEIHSDVKSPELDTPPSRPAAEPDSYPPPPSEASAFEDFENLGDSPSIKPTLPTKTVPLAATPTRFSQGRSSQLYSSSPSPSPLRTSLRENQIPQASTPHWRSSTSVATPGSIGSSPRDKALPSPPVPPKFNIAVDQASSPRSSGSLVPQADESLEAISGFFKTFPKSSDRVNIDTQLMLQGKDDNQKIRTLKKQMWEITADGKRQDLPANQEYILYEGSMYLCVHVFESDASVRSETYLWCGDDVPDAAVDHAQSFCRKVAKDNGCKLETIEQGKETARFIQALGGILITRCGFSSRSSSSAFFMLCGRKHLGQMVFDEVDFSRRNLCSGYPFVISAMFGKLYLWKGKGSSAEEVGAARLIGMDLGLTGEFEEVGEGEEPASFFDVFTHGGDRGDYMRSDYWLLKPNHEHYRLRLLRVDHELGQRSGFWLRRSGSSSPIIRPNDTVQEVEPFCQKDITSRGIYVLDAFFEIYVIVGEYASNRSAEFASAVIFAHEYGILAASLQDRPFIPKSFVSLGGIPDSCRSVFRKWRQRTARIPPQVFPLDAAIDAIRT
ncbi:hypothetical protein BDV59DRAFT_142629 [Aspergillus ambiguus]|uniref:putative gelsolin repeat protein n=1 Tax=Aspergillus ambiguus TaxID=176160 RepID=UPI003CCE3F5C